MREHKDQKPESIFAIPHYKLLSIIIVATTITLSALALVVTKLDPFNQTSLALSLFFISSFLALTGVFAIILFFLKKWWSHDKIYVKHVTISLRQGLLLSICTNICLSLLMLGLLRVWNGLLLVIFITLLEFYLSGRDEIS